MAKKTPAPSNKRLPKANVDRMMQILRHDLETKRSDSLKHAEQACKEGKLNYLKAAEKKYGIAALGAPKLNPKNGRIEFVLTSKVKNDLLRIESPYRRVNLETGDYDSWGMGCPLNKVKEFKDTYQHLKDLELCLLTADSDTALAMYTSAEQQIEGIK